MDVSTIYSQAVLKAEEGVKHDSAGDLALAIGSYESALALIHQGASLDRDEEQRKLVLAEGERYTARVKLLKTLLQASPKRAPPPGNYYGPLPTKSGGSGGSSSGGVGGPPYLLPAPTPASAPATTAVSASLSLSSSSSSSSTPSPPPVIPLDPASTPTEALAAVVSHLTEQTKRLMGEVQAAQEEAEMRYQCEVQARQEAESARAELEHMRVQYRAVMGAAEDLERGRDNALEVLKGAVAPKSILTRAFNAEAEVRTLRKILAGAAGGLWGTLIHSSLSAAASTSPSSASSVATSGVGMSGGVGGGMGAWGPMAASSVASGGGDMGGGGGNAWEFTPSPFRFPLTPREKSALGTFSASLSHIAATELAASMCRYHDSSSSGGNGGSGSGSGSGSGNVNVGLILGGSGSGGSGVGVENPLNNTSFALEGAASRGGGGGGGGGGVGGGGGITSGTAPMSVETRLYLRQREFLALLALRDGRGEGGGGTTSPTSSSSSSSSSSSHSLGSPAGKSGSSGSGSGGGSGGSGGVGGLRAAAQGLPMSLGISLRKPEDVLLSRIPSTALPSNSSSSSSSSSSSYGGGGGGSEGVALRHPQSPPPPPSFHFTAQQSKAPNPLFPSSHLSHQHNARLF